MLLKDKTIFLVEDNPTNLAVIRMLLKKEGANVPFDPWGYRTVQGLLTALQNFPSGVDLILLDIKLPGATNGYEVLKAIRSMPGLQGIPVIAFTAADPDEEMPKAREAGFDGYISKPIDSAEFSKDLRLIIDGQPVWRRYD